MGSGLVLQQLFYPVSRTEQLMPGSPSVSCLRSWLCHRDARWVTVLSSESETWLGIQMNYKAGAIFQALLEIRGEASFTLCCISEPRSRSARPSLLGGENFLEMAEVPFGWTDAGAGLSRPPLQIVCTLLKRLAPAVLSGVAREVPAPPGLGPSLVAPLLVNLRLAPAPPASKSSPRRQPLVFLCRAGPAPSLPLSANSIPVTATLLRHFTS